MVMLMMMTTMMMYAVKGVDQRHETKQGLQDLRRATRGHIRRHVSQLFIIEAWIGL